MTFSRLPYDFDEALKEVKSWRASYKPPQPNAEYERGFDDGFILRKEKDGKREWVGLTDEECDDILGIYITAEGRAKAIEAKLKEKNT